MYREKRGNETFEKTVRSKSVNNKSVSNEDPLQFYYVCHKRFFFPRLATLNFVRHRPILLQNGHQWSDGNDINNDAIEELDDEETDLNIKFQMVKT